MAEPSGGAAYLPAGSPRSEHIFEPGGRAPGLYVHVPFCGRVCPYCDFAVQTAGRLMRAAYLQSLRDEIRLAAQSWTAELPFDTIYIGGGTPSSLTPETLETLVSWLRETFAIEGSAELTLEANPEDVSDDNVAAWRQLGASRLSLGVQSFDAAALEVLGRAHSPAQAHEAVERSLAGGFDAVSLDLIFAVPGSSADGWRDSLQRSVALRPHHISCYELTVHESTPFFGARQRGELVEASGDAKADLFFATHRFLEEAGYPAYEVSNFARQPMYRSRHNRKYWDHTPYLGLGPSAHSFDGVKSRWWNERRVGDWTDALHGGRLPVAGTESLSAEQLVLEELALSLRTTAGIDLAGVEHRFGVDLIGPNAAVVERMKGAGLIEKDPERLVPTLAGLAVADHLAASFEIAAG